MTVRWADVQERLQDDGNSAYLCDIIVPEAETEDWQRALDLLREQRIEWQVKYSEDGIDAELPRLAQDLVSRSAEATVLISTDVAGLPIFGHVFAEDWIEFDVPAREIDGQERLETLMGFVLKLGRAVGKQVRATPESAHDTPIFVYDSVQDRVHRA